MLRSQADFLLSGSSSYKTCICGVVVLMPHISGFGAEHVLKKTIERKQAFPTQEGCFPVHVLPD